MKQNIEIAFNQISFYKKVVYFYVLLCGICSAQAINDTADVNQVFKNYRVVANQSPDSAISQLNKVFHFSVLHNFSEGEINALRFSADVHSLISRYDTALQILNRAYEKAKAVKDLKNCVNIHNLRGNILLDKGNYLEAIECYKTVLSLSNEIRYYRGIAKGYANLGVGYYLIGDYPKAIDFYNEAIPKLEAANDSVTLSTLTSNLSSFYQLVGDFEMAIEVCKKSLSYTSSEDHVAQARIKINLGRNYTELQQHNKALFYYREALSLSKKNGNIRNRITAYNNIGTTYVKLGYFNKGIDNLEKGLFLAKSHAMVSDVAYLEFYISKAFYENKFYKKAKEFGERSSKMADSLMIMELMLDNYSLLGNIYEKLNDFKAVNSVLRKHIKTKNAVGEQYYQKQLTEMEAKYKVDIKEKHIQLLLKDSLHKNEIVTNQLNQLSWRKKEANYLILGGILLFLGTIFSSYFLFKYRRVNKLIFAQKNKVEHQKSVIEVKNRDITDSIKYAERIQKTMLPADGLVQHHLKDAFVLYKPKDIVAGDFYWLEKKNNSVLFGVADCTGHGVPGAIVSVVCYNALNRSVRQYGLTKPNEVLDKSKEIIVDAFSQNEDVRDGMDAALCSIEENKLLFSGANNPLWLFRSGELIVYKPDRQPVGKHEVENPFSLLEVDLEKGDTVYIFSDGFADQFGGEKNKKFKSTQLKRLLHSIQKEDMQKQKHILSKEFDGWRGNYEQMDDVCLMGVRIN